MPKITDTYQLAYACCETILKELNRFPTIDLIRERIGVNSPNTIKKAMNVWTEDFVKHYLEQQHTTMAYPEVPAVLNEAVYQVWRRTVKEAERLADEKILPLQEHVKALQQTLELTQTELTAVQQHLTSAQQQLAMAEQQIITLDHKHALTETDLQESQHREQTLLKTIEALKDQQLTLKEHHRLRLQQEQDWMQRRILEERELSAEKWQTKNQQLQEHITFLKTHYEQAIHSQALLQKQNQQLFKEISEFKKASFTTSADLKFKRKRKFR